MKHGYKEGFNRLDKVRDKVSHSLGISDGAETIVANSNRKLESQFR